MGLISDAVRPRSYCQLRRPRLVMCHPPDPRQRSTAPSVFPATGSSNSRVPSQIWRGVKKSNPRIWLRCCNILRRSCWDNSKNHWFPNSPLCAAIATSYILRIAPQIFAQFNQLSDNPLIGYLWNIIWSVRNSTIAISSQPVRETNSKNYDSYIHLHLWNFWQPKFFRLNEYHSLASYGFHKI